jgi:hypothetical protein
MHGISEIKSPNLKMKDVITWSGISHISRHDDRWVQSNDREKDVSGGNIILS